MNYLYQITNLINNKIYVGVHKTDNIDDGYMGSGTAILRAIKKYGVENFKRDILEFYDTYEAALLAEETLVTEDFLLREDVYNLRTGGIGGWEHINTTSLDKRKNITEYKRRVSSGEIKVGGSKNWTKDSIRRMNDGALNGAIIAVVNAQTPEAKEKRINSFTRIGHQQGEKNSQFGKCWVTHAELGNKKISKEELDKFLLLGYTKGRRMIVN